MEENKIRFLELVDQISTLGVELKKEKKAAMAELENISNQVKEQGFNMIHAKEDFLKELNNRSVSLNEVTDQSNRIKAESQRMKDEAEAMMMDAKDKWSKAEAALKSAEQKEAVASNMLADAQKMKDEIQQKRDKALAMAQAIA